MALAKPKTIQISIKQSAKASLMLLYPLAEAKGNSNQIISRVQVNIYEPCYDLFIPPELSYPKQTSIKKMNTCILILVSFFYSQSGSTFR